MHSGIVNGYHTVPGQQRGTASLFLFYSPSSISAIYFMCHSDSPFSILGCLNILCLQSNEGSRVSIRFPDRGHLSVHTLGTKIKPLNHTKLTCKPIL